MHPYIFAVRKSRINCLNPEVHLQRLEAVKKWLLHRKGVNSCVKKYALTFSLLVIICRLMGQTYNTFLQFLQ